MKRDGEAEHCWSAVGRDRLANEVGGLGVAARYEQVVSASGRAFSRYQPLDWSATCVMLGPMKTLHDKLVRDRIPELLSERGVAFAARVADCREVLTLLNAKLAEETAEYLAAADDEARIEELADVLEVILELGSLYGADRDSLESTRARKAAERGTFDARIVLISTDSDEKNLGSSV